MVGFFWHACSIVHPTLKSLNSFGGLWSTKTFHISCLVWPNVSLSVCHPILTKIEEFTGGKDELNVVEFFLRSAKVLRELEIVFDLSSEEQLNISQKVSLFPKCSATCEIVFTSTEESKYEFWDIF
ncbi:hypothetical protein LguiB_018244 [Lonicera macranthoides]